MESESEPCDNSLLSVWGSCDKWTISEFPPIESSSEHIVQYENQTGDNISKMKNCFGTPENPHHVKRWELMKKVLNEAKIKNVSDLEVTIKKYNSYNFPFETLNKFFEQILKPEESKSFFTNILPKIIQLALELPLLIPGEIIILKHNTNITVTYTQQQICSILANAFLCTFRPKSEHSNFFPSINFYTLYTSTKTLKHFNVTTEKLKCIIHYFKKVTNRAPLGKVTFSRRYLPLNQLPKWCYSTTKLTKLIVQDKGYIEEQEGMLQVDFANCKIGGGVLSRGGVQEEIRFSINPELIAARLFTVQLDSTEALIICGTEQYSKYSGYSDTFRWEGNHLDQIPFDKEGRRMTTLTCIDALSLKSDSRRQFSPINIIRELNKAFVGFYNPFLDKPPPVATGNWGCGAFRGDSRLKALIQLMAASQAGRNVAYFTFGDKKLADDIAQMFENLHRNQTTIGELWKLLCQFYQKMKADHKCKLYDFLKEMLNKNSSPRLGMNINTKNSWISLDDSLSTNGTDLNKQITSEDSESGTTLNTQITSEDSESGSDLNKRITSEDSESDLGNLEKDNLIEESPESISEKQNFQISSSSSNNSNESLDKFFQDPFKNSQKSHKDECDIYFLNDWLDDTNQAKHSESNNNPKNNIQSSNSTNSENDTLIEEPKIESNNKNSDNIPKNNIKDNFSQSLKTNLENITSDSDDSIKNCPTEVKPTLHEPVVSNTTEENREQEEIYSTAGKIEEKTKKKNELFKEISSTEYRLPLYNIKSKELINTSDESSHTSKNPFKVKDRKFNKLKTENQASENIAAIELNSEDNNNTLECNILESSELVPTIPSSSTIDSTPSTPNEKKLENKINSDNNTDEQNTLENSYADTSSNSACEFIPKTPTSSLSNKKSSTPTQRKSVKRIKKNHLENTPKITKYFKVDKN